ncbi:hypothetical protein IC229_04280 [Spirosoma sp. BT702]|uniref:Uncharacterized protein n=1 Tax=Spirosoma profusum TaxID=2771354 RepID=A0A927ARJ0_9BACT|nr:hypothetical protein [Spirosoma profusum]MBD2699840.1 hypothetical protein [Spirosoma profusum]
MISASWMLLTIIIILLTILAISYKGFDNKPSVRLGIAGTFFALMLPLLSYLFLYSISEGDKSIRDFDRWEKAAQVATAYAAFISIIASVIIYRESRKINISQTIVVLFEKFRDDRFDHIRKEAWQTRYKWKDNDYKAKSIKAYFESNLTGIIDAKEREAVLALKKELRYVRDILEFYNGLIPYKEDATTLRQCRYFFYDWWRPFLYEFAEQCDKYYKPTINLSSQKFDNQQYLSITSYTLTLNQLDKIFGFEKIPTDFEFHD